MGDFFNLQHPFFRPMWRRVLATVLCFAWAGVELSMGATPWAVAFAVAGAWMAFQFFIAWTDPEEEE
ncbi:hypothetical protein KUV47_03485 [Vannielia litorea]|uniref:hypothetical protein n=1 Tax=Vannielia TaxID=2813041 RepID=UPI001C970BA4|nr:hypothetical protein [Vannielia litorea]MBY6152265.1 hypothetical protein [Vannielia litorea]